MIGTLDAISFGTWAWVEGALQSEIRSVNNISTAIAAILQNTKIYDSLISSIPDELKSSIRGLSLTLISLFLLIDFFKKSTDLKWVTWENVLMFFIKFIFAKVCVDNAEWLMSCVYNGFASLTDALFNVSPSASESTLGSDGASNFPWLADVIDGIAEATGKTGYTLIPLVGQDAWKNPDTLRYFLSNTDIGHVVRDDFVWLHDFTPIGVWLLVVIQGIIMKAILTVTFVIVMARFMELAIYTVAAPLPLATFGSDGLQDIGKSYLKSYAACCIHAVVLLLIFICFCALNTIPSLGGGTFFDNLNLGGFYGLVKTFILGATVMKSEQWAKRICGAI